MLPSNTIKSAVRTILNAVTTFAFFIAKLRCFFQSQPLRQDQKQDLVSKYSPNAQNALATLSCTGRFGKNR